MHLNAMFTSSQIDSQSLVEMFGMLTEQQVEEWIEEMTINSINTIDNN